LIKGKPKQGNKESSNNQPGGKAEKKVARSADKTAHPKKPDFEVAVTYEDITRRKMIEDALRTRDILSLFYDNVYDVIFIIGVEPNDHFRFISVNRRFTVVTGLPEDQVVGKLAQEVIPEPARALVISKYKEAIRNRQPASWEEVSVYPAGTKVGEVTVVPVFEANGNCTQLIGTVHDITEHRQAEDALKASEEQYRLLSEHTTDTVWLMDMDLKIIYHSPSVEKLRGFTAQEIMAMPLEQHVTPESLKFVSEIVLKEIPMVEADPEYNPILTLELEYTCKDGTTVWAESKFSVIRDESGKPVSILGEARDITERRQASETLQKSEQLYRSLFENMLNGFAYCMMIFEQGQPHDFIYLSVNAAFEKQTGLTNVTGKKVSEVIPGVQDSDPHIFEIYGRVALTGVPEHFETYLSALKIWLSISVFCPRQGYFVAVFDNITERKLAEEKLTKSYENLQKTLHDAINTMVKIVELRDPYTAGHQQNVADLAIAIAREMKLEDARIDQLRMAAVIHDIGKMYVPSDILSKPGKLSDIEFSLIKSHSQGGYEIVKSMDLPCSIANTVLQHHERLDGSGYPNQLKGEDTLLEAKILAVADVIEAMASHRPYRSALGIDKALEEISRNKGKLYDPDVVNACLDLFNSCRFTFKSV